MKIPRDVLEQMALKACSEINYYDLTDNIDNMSDDELRDLIACNGSYVRELKLGAQYNG